MHVCLRIVQGRPEGKEVTLGPGDYIFGRGPECQVRFNSEWVSRQHAALIVGDSMATVRDLGSSNGTLLNGVLLTREQPLLPGDLLEIGPMTLEVRYEEEAPAAAAHGKFVPDEGDPSVFNAPTETLLRKPRLEMIERA